MSSVGIGENRGGHVIRNENLDSYNLAFNQYSVKSIEEPIAKTTGKFSRETLSSKQVTAIRKAQLTIARNQMFPENVIYARVNGSPRIYLKKGSLIRISGGLIPLLAVNTKQVAPSSTTRLDLPVTLEQYFTFDSRNTIGIKDICLLGTLENLKKFLETKEKLGIFSKIPEDDCDDKIETTNKRYPIYAGIFTGYSHTQKTTINNPHRDILVSGFHKNILSATGAIIGSSAPAMPEHVKLPTTAAQLLRTENRVRRNIGMWSRAKSKKIPIKILSNIVNRVSNFISRDIEKKDNYDPEQIFMLQISYMLKDGFTLVGEKEISLRDLGKNLGILEHSEGVNTELNYTGNN